MRKIIMGVATVLTMGFAGMAALADGHGASWVLDPDASTVSFGSVKKDTVGESNHFSRLSGSVSKEGDVAIDVDLTSLETWIDIRNERVAEHVFLNAPSASFTAKVDMASLEGLAVGAMQEITVDGNFVLGGTEISIQAEMIAVRLSEMRVMMITAEMFWLSTEEAGIDPGIDKLEELAGLSGITRAFPVTLRLVFDHKM